MGPDLTIDLNLLRSNTPVSTFTAFTTHVEVSILRCETIDFPDLTGYKYLSRKERFFIFV